jgi:uncharacterized protein with PQ loop repeat
MTFEAIISTLTVIASFSTKAIGAPSQIKQLLKTKNSESFSILHGTLIFVAYILWAIHGYLKNDLTVMVGQGIGVITSGLILFFVIKYRNTHA